MCCGIYVVGVICCRTAFIFVVTSLCRHLPLLSPPFVVTSLCCHLPFLQLFHVYLLICQSNTVSGLLEPFLHAHTRTHTREGGRESAHQIVHIHIGCTYTDDLKKIMLCYIASAHPSVALLVQPPYLQPPSPTHTQSRCQFPHYTSGIHFYRARAPPEPIVFSLASAILLQPSSWNKMAEAAEVLL